MYPALFPRPMAFRAFVAVPVAPLPALGTLLDEIGRLRADLKTVEASQLHFTLSFLGNVPDEARAALGDAIREAARGVPAFDLELRAVGAFPSARRPRVVWAGVADPKAISELATLVRAELAKRDLPRDDKDFRAHLTLARVRSEKGVEDLVSFLRHHGHDDLGSIHVSEVVLYRSVLSPRGPAYEALETAPLEA